MLNLVISFAVGLVAGAVGLFFFLRNNKQKAAALNVAVAQLHKAAIEAGQQAGATAATVSTAVSAAFNSVVASGK
jgi:hypothetical protein